MSAARIVFVSGASRGIGRAIAEHFLKQGDAVAVGYHRNRALALELAGQFPSALAVEVNLAERDSIREALRKTREHFGGPVQVLVNNGAMAQEKPFLEIDDADWDLMLATNLRGPFACTQEALPPMIEAGWGRIINISSIGGQWGGMNQVHYAAAKAGLINLTRSTAKVFSGKGITCNAIAPGLVATDMIAGELQTEAGQTKVKSIPAGRLGTLEEAAATAYFLSTEAAGYITGQTINLNGGMYFG